MKVLVIGGTLYFGKVTVRKLLARGDDEVAFAQWWRDQYGQFMENAGKLN